MKSTNPSFKKDNLICVIQNKLVELKESEFTSEAEFKKLSFIAEQFKLIFAKARKYSVDMMIWSFMVHFQSSATYSAIRNTEFLTLPHGKYLQQLSAAFNISPSANSTNKHFLQIISERLTERERHIILQLDEIYVNRHLEYKGGNYCKLK